MLHSSAWETKNCELCYKSNYHSVSEMLFLGSSGVFLILDIQIQWRIPCSNKHWEMCFYLCHVSTRAVYFNLCCAKRKISENTFLPFKVTLVKLCLPDLCYASFCIHEFTVVLDYLSLRLKLVFMFQGFQNSVA